MSNRLYKCFEATNRDWNSTTVEGDEFLAQDGRIMDSMLSEHLCEGWLERLPAHRPPRLLCLLRELHPRGGLHGGPARQMAQGLQPAALASEHCLAEPDSVLQRLAAGPQRLHPSGPRLPGSHRQQKADVVRLYLPPDANCLLSCFDHCIRSRDYVNVLVTSKHPRPQWLTMEQAVKHCTQGVGIWDWASNDAGEADVVMACCGDTPPWKKTLYHLKALGGEDRWSTW